MGELAKPDHHSPIILKLKTFLYSKYFVTARISTIVKYLRNDEIFSAI